VKHNVYLFSGLGADERVFKNLKFPKSQIYHIKWPNVTKDTARDFFLSELLTQIKTKKNNVFLGVSFGGLIAQDIAQSIPVEKLIIVSSVIDDAEMPGLYKSPLLSLFLKVVPNFLLNKPNGIINFMFSTKTDEGRKTLHDIILDTDPTFLRWAVSYLRKWKKPTLLKAKRTYRIHGSNDRVFPKISKHLQTEVVPGGHFAIYESGSVINALLKSWL
jgi:pimeloyl-ACP methyl ester carboxylesterase